MPNGNNYFALRNVTPNGTAGATAIRSVRRAVDILICLSNGVNTLADICSHTNLTKPTAYRLLKTLEELYMAVQDPVTRRYYLGAAVAKLASNPRTNHHDLITCALDEMTQLWDATGENIELNIMIGSQYDRLYEKMSKHRLKVIEGADPVGSIFVGSAAKVLLSQLRDEELKLVIKRINIRKVTERSVTDKRVLMAQIKKVREQGWAISYGERIEGALCVSAPVQGYFWPVALSLVGPESRLESGVDNVVKKVVASARRITENVGAFILVKGGDNQRTVKMKP